MHVRQQPGECRFGWQVEAKNALVRPEIDFQIDGTANLHRLSMLKDFHLSGHPFENLSCRLYAHSCPNLILLCQSASHLRHP